MNDVVADCTGLSRVYEGNGLPVTALSDVGRSVRTGEFVSLAGTWGSGKSTLRNLIGALDHPSGGAVTVDGQPRAELSEAELADLRLNKIGFVFQAYNLVPVLSARENVEFVMQLQGVRAAERRSRAHEVLGALGIETLAERRPGELSGGQQQRVAVARAIVTRPVLLLADEPSANLDSKTTEELLNLLELVNRQFGVTILTATHDPLVISHARRRIRLRDGSIYADETNGK